MNERYPIGKLQFTETVTKEDVERWIKQLEDGPEQLMEAVKGLTEDQLNSPYNEGGWTLKQIIHHLADAQLNAYVRVKLALTEDQPTIKPFDQDSWAELADSELPAEVSVILLTQVHKRLTHLLKSLSMDELKRTVNHPEMGALSIEKIAEMYAWHSSHHVAQVVTVQQQNK